MVDDFVTVEDMAAMHNVNPHTIRRILWQDQKYPEHERKLPGAYKVGSTYRGEWRIPRRVAETWKRDPRGRQRD